MFFGKCAIFRKLLFSWENQDSISIFCEVTYVPSDAGGTYEEIACKAFRTLRIYSCYDIGSSLPETWGQSNHYESLRIFHLHLNFDRIFFYYTVYSIHIVFHRQGGAREVWHFYIIKWPCKTVISPLLNNMIIFLQHFLNTFTFILTQFPCCF